MIRFAVLHQILDFEMMDHSKRPWGNQMLYDIKTFVSKCDLCAKMFKFSDKMKQQK